MNIFNSSEEDNKGTVHGYMHTINSLSEDIKRIDSTLAQMKDTLNATITQQSDQSIKITNLEASKTQPSQMLQIFTKITNLEMSISQQAQKMTTFSKVLSRAGCETQTQYLLTQSQQVMFQH